MKADYVLDYDVLSRTREHHLYLLARIKAGPMPHDADRRPLNLCVVLDRSSSMTGDKLANVKKAAQFLVQRLGGDDRFSLVTYNEAVEVNLRPGPALQKDAINQAIQAIRALGTTNLSGGWLQGCTLVAENLVEGQVNRVLLLTDGLANEGVTDADRLATMANQKRVEGVTTTTMGVGLDFNEDLLTRLATEGGGAFYFIDNPDQAPQIFTSELQDLMNVVGQNLTITLTLQPEVNMVRQLNAYPAAIKGREITFRLGDLYADELKTMVLELAIPAMGELGRFQVGELRFDYDELGGEHVSHQTLKLPILVNTVDDADFEGQAPNAEVVKSALMLRAARAREEAIQYADKGEFQRASEILGDAADAIDGTVLEDDDLQKQHDMLREEAVDMEMGARRYDSYSRKTSTTKLYTTSRRSSSADSMDQTVALHGRLKASRAALERSGDTPSLLTWKREQMDLSPRDHVHIGRAADNDIVIPEEDVSTHHCRIVREEDDLILEDLGSTNGTFANGGQLQGRFRLSAGDIMTVGSWLFMFKG